MEVMWILAYYIRRRGFDEMLPGWGTVASGKSWRGRDIAVST